MSRAPDVKEFLRLVKQVHKGQGFDRWKVLREDWSEKILKLGYGGAISLDDLSVLKGIYDGEPKRYSDAHANKAQVFKKHSFKRTFGKFYEEMSKHFVLLIKLQTFLTATHFQDYYNSPEWNQRLENVLHEVPARFQDTVKNRIQNVVSVVEIKVASAVVASLGALALGVTSRSDTIDTFANALSTIGESLPAFSRGRFPAQVQSHIHMALRYATEQAWEKLFRSEGRTLEEAKVAASHIRNVYMSILGRVPIRSSESEPKLIGDILVDRLAIFERREKATRSNPRNSSH